MALFLPLQAPGSVDGQLECILILSRHTARVRKATSPGISLPSLGNFSQTSSKPWFDVFFIERFIFARRPSIVWFTQTKITSTRLLIWQCLEQSSISISVVSEIRLKWCDLQAQPKTDFRCLCLFLASSFSQSCPCAYARPGFTDVMQFASSTKRLRQSTTVGCMCFYWAAIATEWNNHKIAMFNITDSLDSLLWAGA